MIGYFKKIEEELLTKRPDIWFTRMLWVAPVAITGLIISIFLGYNLPKSSNMTLIVVLVSVVAATILYLWYRLQYLYFDKTINPKQLFRIFLINLIGISTLTWMVLAIPVIVQGRISKLFDEYGTNFSSDVQKIRLAMISQQHLDLIREGAMEQRYLDSVKNKSWDEYYWVDNSLAQLRRNKFYEQNFTDVSLSFGETSIADTAASAIPPPPSDSTTLPDSIAYTLDSSKQQINAPQTQLNTASRVPAHNYSYFENYIRSLTNDEITKIKLSANQILDKYDFSNYPGDSTEDDLNYYFATLSSQSLNLYNSRHFLKGISYAFIFFTVFIFTQFLMTLLGKYDIPITLLSYGFLLINEFLLIFTSPGDKFGQVVYFYFYSMGAMLIPLIVISGIFTKRARIDRFRLFSLQFVSLSLPIYFAVTPFMISKSYLLDQFFETAWGLPVFLGLIFSMSLYFNYLFYKRYHYILNLPRR